jgi:cytochrome c oxidase subunit 1
MPRRYYDYTNWESFKMFVGINQFITIVAIIVFAVQLLFLLTSSIQFLKEEKLLLKIHGVQLHLRMDNTN